MKIQYGLRYIPKLRESDYVFGSFNGIEKKVLIESGNWSDYQPTPESQAYVYFDDYSCVTHSHLLCISAVFDRQIDLGMISIGNLQWLEDNGYFDENGKINFNDRFTAVVSDTVCNVGNYQVTVADAIRAFGLTPQSQWNYDKDDLKSCSEFMSKPPQFMYTLGEEFKKRFLLNYDAVRTDDQSKISEALTYSPIQVIVRAWVKNDDGLYINPDNRFNHAVTKYKPANPTHWIWDSYSDYDSTPFEKELVEDYTFGNYAYPWYVKDKLIEKPMSGITYKKEGEPAVYFAVGRKLVPFATTWEKYLEDFSDAALVELTPDEFSKFEIASAVEVKAKN